MWYGPWPQDSNTLRSRWPNHLETSGRIQTNPDDGCKWWLASNQKQSIQSIYWGHTPSRSLLWKIQNLGLYGHNTCTRLQTNRLHPSTPQYFRQSNKSVHLACMEELYQTTLRSTWNAMNAFFLEVSSINRHVSRTGICHWTCRQMQKVHQSLSKASHQEEI